LVACGQESSLPAVGGKQSEKTVQEASGDDQKHRLKTLIVARSSEPEWLNPVAGHQHADSDMAIFRGLFKYNASNELVTDMARDWQVSVDGKVYTINLRPDIKWHDGHPFTAEDVKFTIEAILHPKSHSSKRKDLSDISKIEILDQFTVRITLGKPLASFPGKLRIGLIPKHVLEGKDFNTDEFNSARPVGTGPFKIKEYRRGEYLVLEANPDYYDGRAILDQVIYKFLPDPNVRLVQLKKGEVDVALLTPKQAAAIRPEDDIHLEIVDTTDYLVMMFNLRESLFKDIRVRRAIQYATDRKALVQGALMGYGYPAYGPLQFNRVSAPDIRGYDNELDKARILLAEAGWKAGTDGVLVKNGQRLLFPLFVMANDPVRQDLATILAEQLGRVGIEVSIQIRDSSGIKIQQFPSFILGGGQPGDPDDDVYPYFSSKLGEGGSNYSGYRNPEVDRLLEQGRTSMDAEERKGIYQRIQRELTDDPPYNYLVYRKHIYGVRKGVSGFRHKVFGHGTSPLWNIEEWNVEPER
jgi:peptide/nickel transport system substrate-binding protein